MSGDAGIDYVFDKNLNLLIEAVSIVKERGNFDNDFGIDAWLMLNHFIEIHISRNVPLGVSMISFDGMICRNAAIKSLPRCRMDFATRINNMLSPDDARRVFINLRLYLAYWWNAEIRTRSPREEGGRGRVVDEFIESLHVPNNTNQ